MTSIEPTDQAPLEQAGAVPYRTRDGEFEFCLITSVRSGRWGFPKGIIDPGETAAQTALKESHEEAGLTGEIVGEPLGRYEYFKWQRTLHVTVYLLRVTGVADDWEEAALRRRAWATAKEARQLIDRPKQRKLLEAAIAQLAGE